MKGTITGKILKKHLVSGVLSPGNEIGIKIDQTLTQDATGILAYLEFESLNIAKVKTELSVSYVDHNIIQTDFKNADDHRYLQSAARRFGVVFSPAGNGVSHHIHRQRFGIPGKTLLGSDSHTTTGGCLGMLAIGAGGVDVAMALAGKPYFFTMPEVWGIRIEGNGFRSFVSGKDLILSLLSTGSCKAGIGKIMEFYGPGVKNMDMAARSTIANMAVDMGFTACVFPSDSVTKEYMTLNGRENDWNALSTEHDAEFDNVIKISLENIEPMVACPSSPDNVKPAKDLGHVPVSQVIIGSSCNGSYRDIMVAAGMLKDNRKSPDVYLEINPGSRQTLENVLRQGGLELLINAGARIHEAGCLGCIGMGQAPATGTNSLRTFPRNFKGRSGTKDDQVYLCSPETAAASSITGYITDPRTLDNYQDVRYPKKYYYNPDWFIYPGDNNSSVELIKGPNIKSLPKFNALEDSLSGVVLIKVGNDISTDTIMPAGNRILPLRGNIPAISKFVFEGIDATFSERALTTKCGVVVGGENYGQGSSREHAALAPRFLGVRVKIAKSFARIHKSNLINSGILPLTFKNADDYEHIVPGSRVEIPHIKRMVEQGEKEILITVDDRKIETILAVSARERTILIAGGILNLEADTDAM
jgi:aconitate hydratase